MPGSAPAISSRSLYLGDNLDVLRRLVPPESVDLVYLDPPFNTGRDHALHGSARNPRERAFGDRWRWGTEAEAAFADLVETASRGAASLFVALRSALGETDVLAHLVMVAVRVVELRRVLRRTGSVYLHCDATASHYLKVVLDAVMGAGTFRREIVWKSGWVSGFKAATRNWVRNHDVILYYVKDGDETFVFNKERAYRPHPPGYRRRGGPGNSRGVALDDVWDEPALFSPGIKSFSREKSGFPTQKPLTLLERIVAVSSRPGDVVLDPFCGSGTCLIAAEALGRAWIGIDSSPRAIEIARRRLREKFGLRVGVDRALARRSKPPRQAASPTRPR